MITGALRCGCGMKFIAEATLYKTNGACPKCGRMIDKSYVEVR